MNTPAGGLGNQATGSYARTGGGRVIPVLGSGHGAAAGPQGTTSGR